MQPDPNNTNPTIAAGVGPNSPYIGIPGSRPDIPIPQPFLVAAASMGRVGPAREWDTSILSPETHHASVTSPEDRYYLQPRAPKASEIYDHFLKTQHELGCLVDRHNSQVYRQVYDAFLWVAERAGVDPSNFNLDLIRSPAENAFILHHDEIAKPHIFITTGFLEKIEARFGRLREGHIRFILGHEIAHWKEGHYDQVKRRTPAATYEDPLVVRHIFGNFNFQSAKEYFLSLVFTRDQELVADDLSIRWCAEKRKGQRDPAPLEALQVLDLLAEGEVAERERVRADEGRTRRRFPLLSWAGANAVSTHPASEGRAARGRGSLRQCEVEQSAKDPLPTSSRRWQPSNPIQGLTQDPNTQKTPVQAIMSELNLLVKKIRRDAAFPLQEIEAFVRTSLAHYDASNFDQAIEQVKHLSILLPALYRAHESRLPFEPYGMLKKHTPDRADAELTEKLSKPMADSLRVINEHLRATVEGLRAARIEALEAAGQLTPYAQIQTDFKAWVACSGIYQSQVGDILFFDDQNGLIGQLRQNPLLAIRLLSELGDQFFDFRAISNEWIRPLIESGVPSVFERANWFAQLAQTEHVDLRRDLLRVLLENGILDTTDSVDTVVDFARQAQSAFGNEPFWNFGGSAALLGSEIATWLEQHVPHTNPRENAQMLAALDRIDRSLVNTTEGTNFLTLELLTLFLKPGADDFVARRDWLIEKFPPGKARDLALCKLLESETGLFAYCDQNHFQKSHKELPKDSAEALPDRLAKIYLARFLEVAEYFDCGWFNIEMARGNMKNIVLDPGDKSDGQHTSMALTDSPLHSSLLFDYSRANYYELMGPATPEANTVRFYFRIFFDRYIGQAMKRELKGLPKVSPEAFYTTMALPGISRLIPDIPSHRTFPYYVERTHWSLRSNHSEASEIMYAAAEKREGASGRAPSTILRAAILAGSYYPGKSITSLSELVAAAKDLPEGEFRDHIILRELAWLTENACLDRAIQQAQEAKREMNDQNARGLVDEVEELCALQTALGKSEQRLFIGSEAARDRPTDSAINLEAVKELLSLLRDAGDKDARPGMRISTTSTQNAHKFEIIKRVYENYGLYLKFKSGLYMHGFPATNAEAELYNLNDVATEVARMTFSYHYGENDNLAEFQALSAREKLEEITSLFVFQSPDRDTHLLRILKEAESEPSAGNNLYCQDLPSRVYNLLYSPYHRADLGQRIYRARLADDPAIGTNFDRHLDLILDTHPSGSVRRDRALKSFFDGIPGKTHGLARTWEQRDRIAAVLNEEHETTADDAKLIRKGGVQFLEAALNELNVSAKERVDTILWMAGLREKSHLVNCYEAVEGMATSALKDEVDKLTDDEKKLFIRAVLVGPQGILKSDDVKAKKEFLDTLFFSVFHNAAGQREEDKVRYFKAVYDTMLFHIEPERAADFLGNFLVSHLEGKNFNQQVKVFFESFGFVGVKTAQYLVSSTTMIPEDMKEVLMDLTSRVDGPDKRFVYDLAEKIYGPDARKVIKEIGDRVGGGSLMSFYEVTLVDGREGVIGVLRPDIVHALPEDILLVHRLIETMQEAPEVFGGKTVSSDLMENLMWMSLVETNLGRTARLQEKMRKQIQDLSGDIPVLVPEVWSRHEIADAGAKKRAISLNQGPFIFMERAKGVTLDLYLERISNEPDGAVKRKQVMNRIAGVFLDQLTQHGLVHCDLHPGNMLVHEADGKIEITFLDIGLSTELDKNITKALHRYLRMSIGNTDFSHERASLEKAVKNFLGIGEVEEEKAKRWIRWTLDIFESELGEIWDEDLKEKATNVILRVMTDPESSVQSKLTQIMDLTRDLGLVFPRQFYYILRAVSVMDYVWGDVDWTEQATRLQQLDTEDSPDEDLPPINVDFVCEKVALVSERLELDVDLERIRIILEEANLEQRLDNRVKCLRDGLFKVVEDTKGDAPELLHTLLQDQELRDELGLNEAVGKMRAFFDLQRAQKRKSTEAEFGFLAAEPLPKGTARELAEVGAFGRLSPIWRMNFYPGTLVRTVRGGKVINQYLVLGHNQLHDPIDRLELGVFDSNSKAKEAELLAKVVLSDPERTSSLSVSEEWAASAQSYDAHLDRVRGRTRKLQRLGKKDELDTPWELYLDFSQRLDFSNFREFVELGRVIDGKDEIEILRGNTWHPLSECMFEKGESGTDYRAHLRKERTRLGLPTLME